MNNYEIITIFQNSDKLEETKTAFKEILSRHNAEISKEDDWGIRSLNYEVQDLKNGVFHYMTCKIDPLKVKEITHEVKIQNGILQQMIKRVA